VSFAAVLSGIGGLVLGSFANVVVHRLPRKESIVRPASRCPSCGTPIAPRDNVPVLSWLVLRGRCRHCRNPISWRYPAIELLTGLLFALAGLRLPGEALVAYLPFFWVLVVLSFIDLEHKILPNKIVLPSIAAGGALLGVAAAAGPGLDAWLRAAAGGAVGFAAFLALALVYPAGMGMGDVKLSALLGMFLGYLGWGRVFVGFFAGFFAGAVGGLLLVVAGRGGRKTQVPFGPYLAFGAAVGVLFGGPIVEAWLRR
jgi:leader peptidase (prepilin peptidase)/N-methyltransferase